MMKGKRTFRHYGKNVLIIKWLMKQVHKHNIIEYPIIQVTQGITEPPAVYHIQK